MIQLIMIEDKKYPSNHGKPWDKEDIESIKNLFKEGLSIASISERFGRTERSIAFVLYNHGLIDTDSINEYNITTKTEKKDSIKKDIRYQPMESSKLNVSPENICKNELNNKTSDKSYNILDDVRMLSFSLRTENAFIKNNIQKVYQFLKPELVNKIISEKITEYKLEKGDILIRKLRSLPGVGKMAGRELEERLVGTTILIDYKSESNKEEIYNPDIIRQLDKTTLLDICTKFSDFLKSLDERSLKITPYIFNFPIKSEHITLESLGLDLGITRERVRQIKENIVKKINGYLNLFKRLEPDNHKDFLTISIYPYNEILEINQIYYILNQVYNYKVYYNNGEFILNRNTIIDSYIEEIISNRYSINTIHSKLKQLEKNGENVSTLIEYINSRYLDKKP